MAAHPACQSQPDPDRAEHFVADAQLRFSSAIDRCKQAASVTAQQFWQDQYVTRRLDHRRAIAAEANAIKSMLEEIAAADTSEEREKVIKEAVKAMAEERARHEAWEFHTVSAYRSSVDEARGIRDSIVRHARQVEQESEPMHHGLGDEVAALVAKWPQAEWNEDTGVVSVK